MTDQPELKPLHTPEPWSVDPANGDIVSGALHVAIPYAMKAEDKDRVIQCVNACATIANPDDLREERDMLLAFVKKAAVGDHDGPFLHGLARAALAKLGRV